MIVIAIILALLPVARYEHEVAVLGVGWERFRINLYTVPPVFPGVVTDLHLDSSSICLLAKA